MIHWLGWVVAEPSPWLAFFFNLEDHFIMWPPTFHLQWLRDLSPLRGLNFGLVFWNCMHLDNLKLCTQFKTKYKHKQEDNKRQFANVAMCSGMKFSDPRCNPNQFGQHNMQQDCTNSWVYICRRSCLWTVSRDFLEFYLLCVWLHALSFRLNMPVVLLSIFQWTALSPNSHADW